MSEDALPVIGYLYRSERDDLEQEGAGMVYAKPQLFVLRPHEDGQALCDRSAAIAEIREAVETISNLNEVCASSMQAVEYNRRRAEAAEARVAKLEQQFAERAEAFEHGMQAARQQLSEATAWIRVVGEETVLAGYPGGDRVQALANVRAALKQLSAAQERVSAEDVAEAVRLSGDLRNPAFTCDCAIGNDALEASAALLLRLAGITQPQETK